MIGQAVTVIKRNLLLEETWRYPGTILYQDDERVTLEAFFNRPDLSFYGIVLANGDRFVETFFRKRWYNIFTIYDHLNGQRKGWYCNLSYPAEIEDGVISYVDLALDLLIYPDGRQLELDRDEYMALNLPASVRLQAEAAFTELRQVFWRVFPETAV